MAAVEFLILGPLEVRRAGTAVPIRAGRHRALLALLLLEANSIVPAERLIDQLWDGHPPNGAANTLQAYVSQLRRLLEPGRPPGSASDLLLTQSRGYLLRAEDDAIDARRFRRLAQAGRRALSGGDTEGGSSMLRDALSLWRGAALVDFADGWAEPERRHLEELRLSTFEDWIDAELALGRDTSIVSELQAAVQREPLRERLRGQLMLALYRSGRQADALSAYSDTRRLLVEQLGVEPGPDLRALHASVLAHDPALGQSPQNRAHPPPATIDRSPATVTSDDAATATAMRSVRRWVRRRSTWVLLGAVSAVVTVALATVTLHSARSSVAVPVRASSVAVIDPATNRVVAEISLADAPTAIAVTPGSVWAASARGHTLTRIDPSKTEIAKTVRLGATPTGLSAGQDGSVWVAEGLAHRLVDVHSQHGDAFVESLVPLPGCCASPSVVSQSQNVVYTADAGAVRRIDADHPSTVAATTHGVGSAGLAHGAGAIWVSDGWRTITRVFAHTNQVTNRIDVAEHGRPGEPTAMAIGDGQIWAVATGLDEALLLNQSGTSVAAYVRVGHHPAAIAYGAGAFWVANTADGTVSRIDPRLRAVVATIRIGHRVSSVAYGNGRLWAGVEPLLAAQREGGLIVFDDHGEVFVDRPDGTGRRQLTHGGNVENVEPTWSPDGSQILFASNRGPARTNYHFDLYVMNPDGTGQVRLTHDLHAVSFSPVSSPDGTKIAFFRGHVTNGFGIGDVYVMNSDGGGIRRLTYSRGGLSWPHSWTPDSQKIIFTSTKANPGGPGEMYVMNANGTGVRLVRHSRGNDDNPMWSPDGVRVAYSGQDRGPGIYLTTAQGDATVKLAVSPEAGDYIQPAWSPDGTAIAFSGTFEVPSDLFVLNSDGSGLSRLSRDGEDGSPSWQPTR